MHVDERIDEVRSKPLGGFGSRVPVNAGCAEDEEWGVGWNLEGHRVPVNAGPRVNEVRLRLMHAAWVGGTPRTC